MEIKTGTGHNRHATYVLLRLWRKTVSAAAILFTTRNIAHPNATHVEPLNTITRGCTLLCWIIICVTNSELEITKNDANIIVRTLPIHFGTLKVLCAAKYVSTCEKR